MLWLDFFDEEREWFEVSLPKITASSPFAVIGILSKLAGSVVEAAELYTELGEGVVTDIWTDAEAEPTREMNI